MDMKSYTPLEGREGKGSSGCNEGNTIMYFADAASLSVVFKGVRLCCLKGVRLCCLSWRFTCASVHTYMWVLGEGFEFNVQYTSQEPSDSTA